MKKARDIDPPIAAGKQRHAAFRAGLRRFVSIIEEPLEKVADAILHFGVLIVVLVAALIISDVVGRTLLGRSIVGTVELARNCVVLIIFCQAPSTLLYGKMLRVVALFSRFSARVQRAIEGLACMMAFVMFVALIADMWHPMLQAFEINEMDGTGALKMPMAPVRSIVVFLWVVSALSSLLMLIRVVSGLPASRHSSDGAAPL